MTEHSCGCDHDTDTERLECELRICCGDVDGAFEFARGVLDWANQPPEDRAPANVQFGNSSGMAAFILGQMNDMDLIEHGISVHHPWLTDRGKKLLEDLRALGRSGTI